MAIRTSVRYSLPSQPRDVWYLVTTLCTSKLRQAVRTGTSWTGAICTRNLVISAFKLFSVRTHQHVSQAMLVCCHCHMVTVVCEASAAPRFECMAQVCPLHVVPAQRIFSARSLDEERPQACHETPTHTEFGTHFSPSCFVHPIQHGLKPHFKKSSSVRPGIAAIFCFFSSSFLFSEGLVPDSHIAETFADHTGSISLNDTSSLL